MAFLPITYNSSLVMIIKKKIEKSQMKDILQNTW